MNLSFVIVDDDPDDRALERKLAFCQARMQTFASPTGVRLAEAQEEISLERRLVE